MQFRVRNSPFFIILQRMKNDREKYSFGQAFFQAKYSAFAKWLERFQTSWQHGLQTRDNLTEQKTNGNGTIEGFQRTKFEKFSFSYAKHKLHEHICCLVFLGIPQNIRTIERLCRPDETGKFFGLIKFIFVFKKTRCIEEHAKRTNIKCLAYICSCCRQSSSFATSHISLYSLYVLNSLSSICPSSSILTSM